MPKELPAAMFRTPAPMASTTEMADFIARATTPKSQGSKGPELASVTASSKSREGEAVTTVSATITVPQPPIGIDTAWRSKTVRRVDGRELRKQTFYLDVNVSRRLANHCAKYHYEQSRAVERAILALLDACGD